MRERDRERRAGRGDKGEEKRIETEAERKAVDVQGRQRRGVGGVGGREGEAEGERDDKLITCFMN